MVTPLVGQPVCTSWSDPLTRLCFVDMDVYFLVGNPCDQTIHFAVRTKSPPGHGVNIEASLVHCFYCFTSPLFLSPWKISCKADLPLFSRPDDWTFQLKMAISTPLGCSEQAGVEDEDMSRSLRSRLTGLKLPPMICITCGSSKGGGGAPTHRLPSRPCSGHRVSSPHPNTQSVSSRRIVPGFWYFGRGTTILADKIDWCEALATVADIWRVDYCAILRMNPQDKLQKQPEFLWPGYAASLTKSETCNITGISLLPRRIPESHRRMSSTGLSTIVATPLIFRMDSLRSGCVIILRGVLHGYPGCFQCS
ncbi:hypothetical protein Cob_v005909 [Colletotrichum orbiculare MAFF 240422]|uniref:Uncharacterized protein n=1 Tax=Colletotrichum orbiculare (strain 104-T / ATCC 96160 / CBS 514.97 / LARS 414 / MAFF 240422) TaxID=1213857 RepID=A0A484FUL2_COLOR|nr:hypothetical protein Cob_v005909 [Colletotrichum orbiculare MAFF 240422]